jgi:hypothetical protein
LWNSIVVLKTHSGFQRKINGDGRRLLERFSKLLDLPATGIFGW